MLKLKISAVITILLGIISIVWIVYDYIALTDAVYKYGENLIDMWRMVSLGFIPIILFHIAFFLTMFYLFGFLKEQKLILKEYRQLKADAEKNPAAFSNEPSDKDIKETGI